MADGHPIVLRTKGAATMARGGRQLYGDKNINETGVYPSTEPKVLHLPCSFHKENYSLI